MFENIKNVIEILKKKKIIKEEFEKERSRKIEEWLDKCHDSDLNYLIKQIKSKMIPLEEALIKLDKLGFAPSLVNDDHGNWGMPDGCIQDASIKKSDVFTSFFTEKEQFKKTPYEALIYYVKNMEE
jgi:hypothetical protein